MKVWKILQKLPQEFATQEKAWEFAKVNKIEKFIIKQELSQADWDYRRSHPGKRRQREMEIAKKQKVIEIVWSKIKKIEDKMADLLETPKDGRDEWWWKQWEDLDESKQKIFLEISKAEGPEQFTAQQIVFHVECPECDAPPHKACREGGRVVKYHDDRLEDARRVILEKEKSGEW